LAPTGVALAAHIAVNAGGLLSPPFYFDRLRGSCSVARCEQITPSRDFPASWPIEYETIPRWRLGVTATAQPALRARSSYTRENEEGKGGGGKEGKNKGEKREREKRKKKGKKKKTK